MARSPVSTRNGRLGSEAMWQPTVRLQVIDRSTSGDQFGPGALLALGVPVGRSAAEVEDMAQEEPPAPDKRRRSSRENSP